MLNFTNKINKQPSTIVKAPPSIIDEKKFGFCKERKVVLSKLKDNTRISRKDDCLSCDLSVEAKLTIQPTSKDQLQSQPQVVASPWKKLPPPRKDNSVLEGLAEDCSVSFAAELENLADFNLPQYEKEQIAAERNQLTRTFNILKEKEKTLSTRQLTKHDINDTSAQQAEATTLNTSDTFAAKANASNPVVTNSKKKKKNRRTENLKRARAKAKNQAKTTETAIETTTLNPKILPENIDDIIYKLYELSIKCSEYYNAIDRDTKIIELYEDNKYLFNLESKNSLFHDAKFRLETWHIHSCVNKNIRSCFTSVESYLSILDNAIHSLEYFLKFTYIDNNYSIILKFNHSNRHKYNVYFFIDIYVCVFYAICSCYTYPKDSKEKNIQLIKGQIDKLNNIIDKFKQEDLACNYVFNKKQLHHIAKILNIATDIVIDNLNNNDKKQSSYHFNIKTSFSTFLKDYRRFSPEQQIDINSFILSLTSYQDIVCKESNLIIISQVVDILKTTFEKNGSNYNCFMLINILIKNIAIIFKKSNNIIFNEAKKNFFYLIKSYYNSQNVKLTEIINNTATEKQDNNKQKLVECLDILSIYDNYLRLLISNKSYICNSNDESLQSYNDLISLVLIDGEILHKARNFVLSVSADEKISKDFKDLIVAIYVLRAKYTIHENKSNELKLQKRKKNIYEIINKLLDDTCMFEYSEQATSLLHILFTENHKANRSYITDNLEQRILNIYKANMHDEKNYNLSDLNKCMYISMTSDKKTTKEILYKCLSIPNIFDEITNIEQLYNMYIILMAIFYNIGDTKNAIQYSETIHQLNKKNKYVFFKSKFYTDYLLTNVRLIASLHAQKQNALLKLSIVEIIDTIGKYYLYNFSINKANNIIVIIFELFSILVQANLYDEWDKLEKIIPSVHRYNKLSYITYICSKAYRDRCEFIYIEYSVKKSGFTLRQKQEALQRVKKSIDRLSLELKELGANYALYNELAHCFRTLASYYTDKNLPLSKEYRKKAQYNFDQAALLSSKIKKTKYDDMHAYESRSTTQILF